MSQSGNSSHVLLRLPGLWTCLILEHVMNPTDAAMSKAALKSKISPWLLHLLHPLRHNLAKRAKAWVGTKPHPWVGTIHHHLHTTHLSRLTQQAGGRKGWAGEQGGPKTKWLYKLRHFFRQTNYLREENIHHKLIWKKSFQNVPST